MTADVALLAVYDGVAVGELQQRAGASQLVALAECGSTMDIAHEHAARGAPHGTVIVAEQQGAGRGRTGRSWVSPRGAGVWTSVILRPDTSSQGGVLSLRVGIELAERLDVHASSRIALKWPNDLFIDGRKLAGILTEARWRGDQLEWIIVGVGVNVRPTSLEVPSASLDAATSCADVLVAVVQAVLHAGAARGMLTANELQRYSSRDLAAGRSISAPLVGIVVGITSAGGLEVSTADGDAVAVSGSLVFRPSDGAE